MYYVEFIPECIPVSTCLCSLEFCQITVHTMYWGMSQCVFLLELRIAISSYRIHWCMYVHESPPLTLSSTNITTICPSHVQ